MSETTTADGESDTCEVTSADLDIADNVLEALDLTSWSCSRPVWDDDDRCVWHADATDKPLEKLMETIGDGKLHGAQLSGEDISALHGEEMYDQRTRPPSEVPILNGMKFNSVDFLGADLSGADLSDVDLSETDLRHADLSNAGLNRVDLSNKNLSGVNLSRADLRGVSMVGMSADQSTTVGRMRTGLSKPHEYDRLAQGYHELKQALSEEGLSQRARQARALEQQARTAESWSRFKQRLFPERSVDGVRQWVSPPWPGPAIRTQFLTSVGGFISRVLTGYGTRPLYVISWTVAIILITTAIFKCGPAPPDGGWQGGPLYYSVVTFVTAPPHPPRGVGDFRQAVVLLETYLGTALIVLLGYVLGTRERV
jgi:uncharacterized protein YjbI with pentapeptide repeats